MKIIKILLNGLGSMFQVLKTPDSMNEEQDLTVIVSDFNAKLWSRGSSHVLKPKCVRDAIKKSYDIGAMAVEERNWIIVPVVVEFLSNIISIRMNSYGEYESFLEEFIDLETIYEINTPPESRLMEDELPDTLTVYAHRLRTSLIEQSRGKSCYPQY